MTPHPGDETSEAMTALMGQLMASHRSIRRYQDRPVDAAMVRGVLQQALHGSSSSGNLNMISVVLTSDVERKRRLYELHGEQPMILEAPLVLTFCADTHRTRTWLAQRQARLGFVDLVAWHVAAFDAVIVAQTAALAFEARGLGLCYMGTTLYAMREIAELLEMPEHVLPVTSYVLGWPAESPVQRDRLPASAWIHDERYRDPGPDEIDRDFTERDRRGWERYRAMGPEMVERMQQHGIASLAQFYTSRIKYDPDRLGEYADCLRALLDEQGFLHGRR